MCTLKWQLMKLQEQVRLESPLSIDGNSANPSLILNSEIKSSGSDNFVRLTPRFATICCRLHYFWLYSYLSIYFEKLYLGVKWGSHLHYFILQWRFPDFFALLWRVSDHSRIYKQTALEQQQMQDCLSLRLILYFWVLRRFQIHDASDVTHYLIPNLSSILSSAWVVPYAVIGLLVAFYFIRFVFRLPTKTRKLVIVAGFTFVLGALGLEIAETYLHSEFGVKHFLFILNILVQELLEMTGIVLFVYALLDYLSSRHKGLLVKFK